MSDREQRAHRRVRDERAAAERLEVRGGAELHRRAVRNDGVEVRRREVERVAEPVRTEREDRRRIRLGRRARDLGRVRRDLVTSHRSLSFRMQ